MLTARDVERVTFTSTVLRRGYDQREVDEFLERVATTLHHLEDAGGGGPALGVGAVVVAEVEAIAFTQTQVRGGYDEQEVDAFLDRVASTLRHHDADADIRVPSPPAAPPTLPSPVEPGSSLRSRVLRKLRGDP